MDFGLEATWPNIKAALRWIDEFGDEDGDGFVEYARESENGLANQGGDGANGELIYSADPAADKRVYARAFCRIWAEGKSPSAPTSACCLPMW